MRNSFNVGCELIQRKEDLNYDVTVSRCYLRYFADSWVSGDVAETPLADVGHRGLVGSKQASASFSRTDRNAGVNVSIYRWRRQQQHSSQGSVALTALLFYSGMLSMFKWVAVH